MRRLSETLTWPEIPRRDKISIPLSVLGWGSLGLWLAWVVSGIVSPTKADGVALRRGLIDADTARDHLAKAIATAMTGHIFLMCVWCATLTTLCVRDVFAARGHRFPQIVAISLIGALWALPIKLLLFGHMAMESASRGTKWEMVDERTNIVLALFAFLIAALLLGYKLVQALRKPEVPLDKLVVAESTYRRILALCFTAGREMERHPAGFHDHDEESLRDHLLPILSTHYDSASAEAFNCHGKTDILVRHDKANAFVGECKIWRGPGTLRAAIDQIFDLYLTRRDAYAGIICFVRDQDLDQVLGRVHQGVLEHRYFLKDQGPVDSGWHNYTFHFPGSPHREVKLAVLCFHLPKSPKPAQVHRRQRPRTSP